MGLLFRGNPYYHRCVICFFTNEAVVMHRESPHNSAAARQMLCLVPRVAHRLPHLCYHRKSRNTSGIDFFVVPEIFGHTSAETTAVYVRVTARRLTEADQIMYGG